MFIISLTYKVPLEAIDAHLDAHVSFLQEHYDKGIFIASGRKVPRDGGVILATALSQEIIQATIQRDPFYLHGLADYSITEFIPSMTAQECSALLNR